MPMNALTGTRLRERRLALGLRQAVVAQAAGLSASYLNLIEHNRRRVGVDLLDRLAEALNWPAQNFAEGDDSALAEELRLAAAQVPDGHAELDRAAEFAGRYPGWAGVVSHLGARVAGLERALAVLNDRLGQDPYLSASLHEMLSSAASVRSTAAILAETEDIDPEWRTRFHRNMHEDSERLAVGAEALVAYLDRAGLEEQSLASPQDEVEAWAAEHGWDLTAGDIGALASEAARQMAQGLVAQARADVAAMPEPAFRAALAQCGPDPVQIAAGFGQTVLVAMRRIALAQGSTAGLVLCDASGTLTFRKPVEGFALPRFGAACPLWPLFAALGRPMTPIEQVLRPIGPSVPRHFRIRAFCQPRYPEGFGGPELREAAMLILPLPLGELDEKNVGEVGSSCRICPRAACPARREPSILRG